MTRSVVIFCLILLSSATAIFAGDNQQILDQRKDLEAIQKDVQVSQKRLDSLKQAQGSLQRQVAEYDQKLASDQKVITRLNSQLKRLGDNVKTAEAVLAHQSNEHSLARLKYLGDLRQTYLALKRPEVDLAINPNRELDRSRRSRYLAAMAGFGYDELTQRSMLVDSSEASLKGLSGQFSEVKKLKQQKEVSYSLGQTSRGKKEKSLERVNRKSQDEAERMMNLQMAAAEMERIINRLEEERALAQRSQTGQRETSVFAGYKGQLKPPIRGKIIERFGEIVDPVTHLTSFSPGISIQGRAGAAVNLVASGTVAYTGNLRGYGNFVIINHDNQYYTTYAGLGEVLVSQGQHLLSGVVLAKVGDDGMVKFELRRGREPLDPVTWINFESL